MFAKRFGGTRIWLALTGLALAFSILVTASAGGVAARVATTNGGESNSAPNPVQQQADESITSFDCSMIEALGIDKQMNFRAGAILDYCSGKSAGKSSGNSADKGLPISQPQSQAQSPSLAGKLFAPFAPLAYGGTDRNTITGGETSPQVTQSESWVWGHGNTIVATYNDSRSNPAGIICGVSYSTDGGVTFTRITPSPFTGLGSCSGDPFHFYSVRAAKWFAQFFAGSCGGDIGQWESTNGITWTPSGCVITTGSQDRFSGWVDNNPGSPFYGRQYVSSNDFAIGGGALVAAFSTDDGVTWSVPTTIFSSFRRNVQMTGSLGTDGTVFIQSMDEGGGGLGGPRQNFIYRSTNGGVTWTQFQQNAATFLGPGRGTCGFFAGMYTTPVNGYWRHMGWGQPGVGPGSVVHYAYADRPAAGGDPGNIKYIRSTDNGATWSAPIQLNTDTTTRAQWLPSLSVNSQGAVFVGWYDERNTTGDNYQRYGRASTNNGVSWLADDVLSDPASIPKPLQNDPGIQPCYAGDYDYAMFSNNGQGTEALQTWTDGRVSIAGNPQQDVFFDKISVIVGTPTPTHTPCSPVPCTATPTRTQTRTPTNTVTPTPTQTPCGPTGNYIITQTTGGIVAGTTDIGNHADDLITNVALPFSFSFYGAAFASANVSSNGNLQFTSTNASFSNVCLPTNTMDNLVSPHWDDLRTDANTGCSAFASGCGIFTSITGVAPNRIFNIEWRAVYFAAVATSLNFEARLYESQGRIDFIYGTINGTGNGATVGVQRDTGSLFTQFSCDTASLTTGMALIFTQPPCTTPTFTPTTTRTRTPTITLTRTNTATLTRTRTATATPTQANRLVGHVTWQGRPAQPNALQALPITLTLKSGATEVNYPGTTTDASGFFTVNTGLPNGNYSWRVKGPDGVLKSLATDRPGFLANAGAVVLAGAPQTNMEMGLMLAGDCNNDNFVSVVDFNILKNTFGRSSGDPLYDNRSDFNGDLTISIVDFNLQKNTFGTSGAPPAGIGK